MENSGQETVIVKAIALNRVGAVMGEPRAWDNWEGSRVQTFSRGLCGQV